MNEMGLSVWCNDTSLTLSLNTRGLIKQIIASLERTNYVSCDLKTGLWSVRDVTKRKALIIKALRERLTKSLKTVKDKRYFLN